MGRAASLYTLPAASLDIARRGRKLRRLVESLTWVDTPAFEAAAEMRATEVDLTKSWEDFSPLFDRVDARTGSSVRYNFGRAVPIPRVPNLHAFYFEPSDALLFAHAWVAVATALELALPCGVGPRQRYDHRRRKSSYSSYDFVEPDQLPTLFTALGVALAADPPQLEYELPWVLDDACAFVSALTRCGRDDLGAVVVGDA